MENYTITSFYPPPDGVVAPVQHRIISIIKCWHGGADVFCEGDRSDRIVVVAETPDHDLYIHHQRFFLPEAAADLARRVEAAGGINPEHWQRFR